MDEYVNVFRMMFNWLHTLFNSFYSAGITGQFVVFAPIAYFLARAIVAVFRGKNSTDE